MQTGIKHKPNIEVRASLYQQNFSHFVCITFQLGPPDPATIKFNLDKIKNTKNVSLALEAPAGLLDAEWVTDTVG